MDKLRAIINLFKVGYMVSNPAAWKNTAIDANISSIAVALFVVASAYGLNIPHFGINEVKQLSTLLVTVILGLLSLYNAVIHIITSTKVGIIPDDTPIKVLTVVPVVPVTTPTATEQAQKIL